MLVRGLVLALFLFLFVLGSTRVADSWIVRVVGPTCLMRMSSFRAVCL